MSDLTTTITELTQQAGQLLDLPQQIANTAEARIDAIGSYYQQRLATMRTIAYVHQQQGDDQHDGGEAAPLRSIEEALRRTPPGGICEVRLQADYHFAETVVVENRLLRLISDSSVRRRVSLERIRTDEQPRRRITGGLRLAEMGAVRLTGLTVVVPVLDGTWPSYDLVAPYAGVVQIGHASQLLGWQVIFTYCDFEIPAAPFCAVVGSSNNPLWLGVYSCTATDQPLTGRLVASITNSAGTDTTTLPWLVTNLAQI